MNERQLHTLLRVAEAGSLSSAATDLFISVQALRQQIGLLEKEVGVALLVRDFKGVRLTPAGEHFCKCSRELLDDWNRSINETREIGGEPNEPRITIGVYANPMLRSMQQIIDEFSRRHPGIDQCLAIIGFDGLPALHRLRKGDFDILQSCYTEGTSIDLQFTKLFDSQSFCLVSPNHRLACKQDLTLTDLIGERVLIHSIKHHPMLLQKIKQNALAIQVEQFQDDHHMESSTLHMKGIISECMKGNVFVAPEEYCEYFPDLVSLALDTDIRWSFGLYSRRKSSHPVNLFLSTAKELFAI
ncbi:MAG: LysR family transcriptional regulator [Coriobacteriia bacterium]